MSGSARLSTQGGHLPSLDGIRAAAFLMVFLAHAGLENVIPGGFGVTVFFFLSGYLITTLLRRELDETGTISLRQFYLRRVLRIMPPFYLVLALSVLASRWGLVAGGYRNDAVLAQALQCANYRIAFSGYDGMPAGTGVYWSLAVEEHFYLAFPLFLLLLRRRGLSAKAQATTLWLLCAAVLAWRCVLVLALHASPDRTGVATDARIDSILFGCALAVYGNPVLDGPGRFSERDCKLKWLPLSAVLLGFSFLCRNAVFRETVRYSLQGIGLYFPMIVALRFPKWLLVRALNGRAISFAGVISYSLYLVHHVVLNAIGLHVASTPLLRGTVALAVSALFACAMYRLIERPCAEVRRRLSSFVATGLDTRWPARGSAAV